MSTSEANLVATNPRRRILWLVLAHVAIGLTGAVVATFAPSPRTLPGAVLVGIVFGQTSLVGIWGSLGTVPWWTRLIGVVVGVGCLGTLLGAGISELNFETFFIVVTSTLFVTLPLLVARFFRVVIQLSSSDVAAGGRIQFSIRDLMILTFVVACLVTIGKWMQPHLPYGAMFFHLLLFAVTFGVVGVMPVWFVLASNRPVLFGVGLVAVAAGGGYVLGRWNDDTGIWMTATAAEAITVVVSLLVVRYCGYRLVRLPSRPGSNSEARPSATS